MSPEQIESPKISVIISTYNAEEWLKKVLWGFNCQIFKDFEVVVADDGSGPKTKQLLEELSDKEGETFGDLDLDTQERYWQRAKRELG